MGFVSFFLTRGYWNRDLHLPLFRRVLVFLKPREGEKRLLKIRGLIVSQTLGLINLLRLGVSTITTASSQRQTRMTILQSTTRQSQTSLCFVSSIHLPDHSLHMTLQSNLVWQPVSYTRRTAKSALTAPISLMHLWSNRLKEHQGWLRLIQIRRLVGLFYVVRYRWERGWRYWVKWQDHAHSAANTDPNRRR